MTTTKAPATTAHATFTIEREYPVSPARVFHAFVDPDQKRRWFGESAGCTIDEYTPDFRAGGREFWRFRFGDGPSITNETTYHNIVEDQRIVFVYTMVVGEAPFSTSLTTIALVTTAVGTRLTYTEQVAFYDGADSPVGREGGCSGMLVRLGKLLDGSL